LAAALSAPLRAVNPATTPAHFEDRPGHARRQMNIAAGAEKRLGDLGALVRAFHIEDEKGLSRPKYVASGLNFSMKAEIAFCSTPDFSASLP
jgi:hypothetical protein